MVCLSFSMLLIKIPSARLSRSARISYPDFPCDMFPPVCVLCRVALYYTGIYKSTQKKRTPKGSFSRLLLARSYVVLVNVNRPGRIGYLLSFPFPKDPRPPSCVSNSDRVINLGLSRSYCAPVLVFNPKKNNPKTFASW